MTGDYLIAGERWNGVMNDEIVCVNVISRDDLKRNGELSVGVCVLVYVNKM